MNKMSWVKAYEVNNQLNPGLNVRVVKFFPCKKKYAFLRKVIEVALRDLGSNGEALFECSEEHVCLTKS